MFHGLVPDSPVLYAGVKLSRRARRRANAGEAGMFTDEFKAKMKEAFNNWMETNKKKETK
jgi:hypothetical protein